MKTCKVCGEAKPIEDFNRSARAKDGRHTFCRTCHKQRNAEYGRANRERLREYHRQNYAKDRAAHKAKTKSWHQENRYALWEARYRQRCERAGFDPVVERFDKPDVIERYGDSCFYCECGAFEELDHYEPISKGGTHILANVRPSCRDCNLRKRATSGDQYLAEKA